MKNILAENMLRFGTMNLSEMQLKHILTEAKAPVVSQASLLNITPQDLQPFVDKLNGVFAAAAREGINKDTVLASGITPTNQYIELRVESRKNASNIIENNYTIIAPGDKANDHFANVAHMVDFPFRGNVSGGFRQYKNTPKDKAPAVASEPGAYNLQRNMTISGTGDFNQDWYNNFMERSKGSVIIRLKQIFCKNKDISKTGIGAAAIVSQNGQVKGHDRNGFTSNTYTSNIYPYLINPYIDTQTEIRAAIEELVEKKYAAFNAAITSQTPE